MPAETHDPRDIPILTRTVKENVPVTLSHRLRAQLPELVDRILREHAAAQEDPKDHG